MNGPASRNAQNIALARLAVSFGIPQNNAELCFNEAEQRGCLFTEIALHRRIITQEQAQYLLQQLNSSPDDHSGLIDTVQANLAGPQNYSTPSHFHGQQTPVAPQAYMTPPTPNPQSHPGYSHSGFPGAPSHPGGTVADVMIPQPAPNQPSTGHFIRPPASQLLRESTGIPQFSPQGTQTPQGMTHPGASGSYSGLVNPGDSVHQAPLGLSGVQPAYPVTPAHPLPGIHMSQARLPAVGGSSHDSSQPSSYSSYGATGPSMIEASLAEEIFEGERYEVSRTLGDGKVLAKDRRIGREVVMCYGGQSLGEDALATFYRAAQVLAHLDHASIPKVHDIGHNKDMPFYTQDCIVGQRLKKGLDERAHEFEKIPQVLRAFLSMAGGIVHAHEQGIVHTQLSPKRIYLGEHGQIMITDWEQALIDSNAPDSARHLADIACPRLIDREKELKYLAPEISSNRSVGARADVWGLGSLLLFMLTRRRILNTELESFEGRKELFKGRPLPRDVAAILTKALAAKARQRYVSATALEKDIRNYLDGERVEAASETTFHKVARKMRQNKGQAIVLLSAFVILILGLSYSSFEIISNIGDAKQAEQDAANYKIEAEKETTAAKNAMTKAQAPADLAEGRSQLERLLLRAIRLNSKYDETIERKLALKQNSDRVLAVFQDAERLSRSLDKRSLEIGSQVRLVRRVRIARADWAHRKSYVPQPELAVKDYQAAIAADKNDAEAYLGLFLAMRRLINYDAEIGPYLTRVNAMELDAPETTMLRYVATIREGEELIKKARQSRDIKTRDKFVARARKLCGGTFLKEVKSFAGRYPDDSLANELLGRAHGVLSGVGHQSRGGRAREMILAVRSLYRSQVLDPSVPNVVPLVRQYNEKYALHQTWRWINAYIYSRIFAMIRFYQRPDALVEVMELLQQLNHYSGSLMVADQLFDNMEREALNRPELLKSDDEEMPLVLQKAYLLRERSLLALRMKTKIDIRKFRCDAGLQGEWLMLKAHRLFLEGRIDEAFATINSSMAALPKAFPTSNQRALDSLFLLVTDHRLPRDQLIPIIDSLIPMNLPPSQITRQYMAARVNISSHLGKDVQSYLQRFDQISAAMRKDPNYRHYGFDNRNQRMVEIGAARTYLNFQPQNPYAHFIALQSWVNINPFNHTESASYDAQKLIQDRLNKLNKAGQATRFGGFDAVEEIWQRRYWVPRQLHVWGNNNGDIRGLQPAPGGS